MLTVMVVLQIFPFLWLLGLLDFYFSRLHIHLEDTAKENISCHFMTAIEFIHKARSEGGEWS